MVYYEYEVYSSEGEEVNINLSEGTSDRCSSDSMVKPASKGTFDKVQESQVDMGNSSLNSNKVQDKNVGRAH